MPEVDLAELKRLEVAAVNSYGPLTDCVTPETFTFERTLAMYGPVIIAEIEELRRDKARLTASLSRILLWAGKDKRKLRARGFSDQEITDSLNAAHMLLAAMPKPAPADYEGEAHA